VVPDGPGAEVRVFSLADLRTRTGTVAWRGTPGGRDDAALVEVADARFAETAVRWGRIVTVSSQAGRRAFPDGGYSAYGAAKAGVAMYTRYLAQELGPFGVNVNCLAPGYIATGRVAPMFDSLAGDSLESSIALRRPGTPEDCAGALQFLVTELGDYVTGTVIPVDGGSTR
jgi:NAD(P)-dependent dehydrogenase (short-subunit alcohol dehydrogenase family)